jgi:hypothetical protein
MGDNIIEEMMQFSPLLSRQALFPRLSLLTFSKFD